MENDLGVRGEPTSSRTDVEREERWVAWRAEAATRDGSRLLRAFHGASAAADGLFSSSDERTETGDAERESLDEDEEEDDEEDKEEGS